MHCMACEHHLPDRDSPKTQPGLPCIIQCNTVQISRSNSSRSCFAGTPPPAPVQGVTVVVVPEQTCLEFLTRPLYSSPVIIHSYHILHCIAPSTEL